MSAYRGHAVNHVVVGVGMPSAIDRRVGLVWPGSEREDGEGPLVALVGVPDVAVALTPDAILVTRRDRAQSVKAVVDQLAEQGRSDLL